MKLAIPWTIGALSTKLATAQTVCNNAAALCSRSYANITHLGAHDSPFVANASNGFTVSGNQFYDSITQLDTGVRLLTAQVHRVNDSSTAEPTLRLCHTDCALLDAGTLVDWLAAIKGWLDRNTNDVVTILLVNAVQADSGTLAADFSAAGIASYGYIPPASGAAWPTLQSMIASNKRLVTFVASLAGSDGATPYLLDEFTHVFENPYLVLNTSGHSCQPDRPASLKNNAAAAAQSGRLFLMNHFLDKQQLYFQIPDVNNSALTNSPDAAVQGSLANHAAACTAQYGKPPNFVLVDWASVGPAITGVDALNGVAASVSGRAAVDAGILSLTNATASGTSGSASASASSSVTASTTSGAPRATASTTTTGAAARVSSQVSASLIGFMAVFFAALLL